ncbi:MAG: hypothetical protein EPN21_05545 [Methylococcaceae bacterium]|nr:MAG: hypothetical protein EPN21_05545 [Methylococcaceae bacterium]
MLWQNIRQIYPNSWLLMEALDAHTEGDQRILNQLSVIDMFDDSASALNSYRSLHKQAPQREFYVLHTSREQPDIRERHWVGARIDLVKLSIEGAP